MCRRPTPYGLRRGVKYLTCEGRGITSIEINLRANIYSLFKTYTMDKCHFCRACLEEYTNRLSQETLKAIKQAEKEEKKGNMKFYSSVDEIMSKL